MRLKKFVRYALMSMFLIALAAIPLGLVAAEPVEIQSGAVADTLESFFRGLWVHDGVGHKNLVIFPVTIRDITDSTTYTCLDEALESGKIKITEIDSGSVPKLRLEITSAEPMFFMAGEVVTGAKQDRILQHDLIYRGKTGSFDLPVYCVEQGRWTSTSDHFASGKTLGSINVRKSAVMKEGQSKVWAEVRDQNAELSAETATDTFQAGYNSERYLKAQSEFMDKFRDLPSMHGGTVAGVVIAIGGKVTSADIFANPELFRKLWPKVLKAAIMDAVSGEDGNPSDNTPAREFLGTAAKATVEKQENPSTGEEFSLRSENIQGSFIKVKDGITHLALFSGKPSEKIPELREPLQQLQRPRIEQHRQR